MIKMLLRQIIKFLLAVLHNIFSVVLIAVIGVSSLISWVTGTLDILIQSIKEPTPLWGSTFLAFLLLVYMYLKTTRIQTYNNSPEYKNRCFEIGNYKWKTKIYKDNDFEIEKPPICLEHDRMLISKTLFYYCPINNCSSKIDFIDLENLYKEAESYIDKQIRNKK